MRTETGMRPEHRARNDFKHSQDLRKLRPIHFPSYYRTIQLHHTEWDTTAQRWMPVKELDKEIARGK